MGAALTLNNNTIAIQRWYVLLAIERFFLRNGQRMTEWLQTATSLSVNVANILVVASFCSVGITGMGGGGHESTTHIRASSFS
jgi:hypothetical protein